MDEEPIEDVHIADEDRDWSFMGDLETPSDLWTVVASEAAMLYAGLVNPRMRESMTATVGARGARFFQDPLWAEIWAGIVERAIGGEYWEQEVLDWLERTQGDEAGAAQRKKVLDLFAQNTTSAQGMYWTRIVMQNGRRMIAERLAKDLVEHPEFTPSEIVDRLDKAARDISPKITQAPQTLKQILPDAIAEIELTHEKIKTGLQGIDALIKGIGPGNILVVGARTGRGKTSFALNVAVHNAKRGKGVLIVSMEMSQSEMFARIASINDGTLEGHTQDRRKLGYDSATMLAISMTAGHSKSVEDVRASIQAMRAAGVKLDLVIVDYLQLMESPGKFGANRQEQVAELSRGLKRLSMTEGLPMIVLSQLRRLEKDEKEEPKLDQLRESGAIEQDATAVVLLSNKENIGFNQRVLLAEVAKNRHGATGKRDISFDLTTQRMADRAMDDGQERMF